VTDANRFIHLCGVGQYKGMEIRQHALFMQPNSELTLNGEVVYRDIRFFGSVRRHPDPTLVGAPAVCRSTGVKRPSGTVRFGLNIDDPRVK
jgi:hypothetical protein